MSVSYENNNVTVNRTAGDDVVVYLRPGDNVKLNFNIEDASKINFIGNDVVIEFLTGGRLTLAHYSDIQLSDRDKVVISDNNRSYSAEEFMGIVGSKISSTTNDSNFLVLFRDLSSVKVNEDGDQYGSADEMLDDDSSESRPSGDGDTEGPQNLDTLVSTSSQFQLRTLNFYTENDADVPVRYTTVFSNKDKNDDIGTEITPVLTIAPTVTMLYGTRTDYSNNELSVYNGAGISANPTLMYNPAPIDYSYESEDMVVRLRDSSTIQRTFEVNLNNRVVILQEMTIEGIPDSVTLVPTPDSSFTLEKVGSETYALKPLGAISGTVSFYMQYDVNVEPVIFDMSISVIGYNPQTETLYYGDKDAIVDIHQITGPDGLGRQSDVYFNASSLSDPVWVITGSGNDTVYGEDYRTGTFETSGGDDVFYGSKANEIVSLGDGDDTYLLSEGIDYADGGAGINDQIVISDEFAAEHTIGMQLNKNIIYVIDNDPENNSTTSVNFAEYKLTNADDVIEVINTDGIDSTVSIDALEGVNSVQFRNSGNVIAVGSDLYVQTVVDGILGSSILVKNVYNFLGSEYDDLYLASNDSEITFNGLGGTDVADFSGLIAPIVYNEGGNAEVVKSTGYVDIVIVDKIIGTDYADTFYANFTTGVGNNITLDGAGGIDTVSYIQSTQNLNFNLSNSNSIIVVTESGTRTDILNNIENIVASNNDDTFEFYTATASGYEYYAEDGIDTADYSDLGKIEYIQDQATGTVTVRRFGPTGGLAGTDTLISFEKIIGSSGNDDFMLTDTLPSNMSSNTITVDGGGGAFDQVTFTSTSSVNVYYRQDATGEYYSDIQFESAGSANYIVYDIDKVTLSTNDDTLFIDKGNSANVVTFDYIIDAGLGTDIINITFNNAVFEATNDLINNKLIGFEEVHFSGLGNNQVKTFGFEFMGTSFAYRDNSQSDKDIFDASNVTSSAEFNLLDTTENIGELTLGTGGTVTIEKFEHIVGTSSSNTFVVDFLATDIAVTYDGATGNNTISYAAATEDIRFNLGAFGGNISVSTESRTSVDTLKNFNSIVSGSGDDVFLLDSSNPYGTSIDGGDGIDYISYENFVLGQNIDLNLLGSLANIEGVIGSRGADIISTLTDGSFFVDGSDGVDSIKFASNDYVQATYSMDGVSVEKFNGSPAASTGTDTITSIELVELTSGDDSLEISQFQNTDYDANTFTVDMSGGNDTVEYVGGGVVLDFDNQDSSGNYHVMVSKDYNSSSDTYGSFDRIYNNETFTLSSSHQDKVYLSASYFTSGLTTVNIDAGGNSSATSYKDADLLSFSRSSNSQVIDLTSGGTISIGGINYVTTGFSAFEGSLGADTIMVSDPSALSGDYYVNGYVGVDRFNGANITDNLTLDLSQDDAYIVGSDISQTEVNKLTIGSVATINIHDIEMFNLTGAGDTDVTLGRYKGYTVNLNSASTNTVTYNYDESYSVFVEINRDLINVQTSSGYDTITGASSIVLDNNMQDAVTFAGDYSSVPSSVLPYGTVDGGGDRNSILFNQLTNTGGLVFNGDTSGSFAVETNSGSSIIASLDNFQNFTGTTSDDTFNLQAASVTNPLIIDGDAGVDTIDYSSYSTGLRFSLGENRILNKSGDTIVTYTNIERIIGTSGDDDFIIGGSSSLSYIDAGAGADSIDFSLSASAINVSIGSSVGSVTIVNTEGVRGTLYDDVFTAGSSTSATDYVQGNVGNDTLDLSYYSTSGSTVLVKMDTSGSSFAAGEVQVSGSKVFSFAEMEIFKFNASVDAAVEFSETSYSQSYTFDVATGSSLSLDYSATLTGGNGLYIDLTNQTVIKGGRIDTVTNKTEFDITGSADSDVFIITGSLPYNTSIDGVGNGSGTDTARDILIVNNPGNSNVINFTTGVITITPSAGGSSTNVTFSNIESIITGDGDDRFIMQENASNTALDAGGGNNIADYSAFSVGITYDALTARATYVNGGSNVEDTLSNIFNIIGSSTASNTFYGTVSGSYNFVGGSGNDTINYSKSAIGVTFNVSTGEVLKGTAIDTYSNIDVMIGSNRNDYFIFNNAALSSSATYNGGGGIDTATFDLTAGTVINIDFIANTISVGGSSISASFVNFSNFVFGNDANDSVTFGGESSGLSNSSLIDTGSGTDTVTVQNQGSSTSASVEAVSSGLEFMFSNGKSVTILNAENFVVNLDEIYLTVNDFVNYNPVSFTGTAETFVIIRDVNASNADLYDMAINFTSANTSLEAFTTGGSSAGSQSFINAFNVTLINDIRNYRVVIDQSTTAISESVSVSSISDLESLTYLNTNSATTDLVIDIVGGASGALVVHRSPTLQDSFTGAGLGTSLTYDAGSLSSANVNLTTSNLIGNLELTNTTGDISVEYALNISGFIGVEVDYFYGAESIANRTVGISQVGSSNTMYTKGFNKFNLTDVNDIFKINLLQFTLAELDMIANDSGGYYREVVDFRLGEDTLEMSGISASNNYNFVIFDGRFSTYYETGLAGESNRHMGFANVENVILTNDAGVTDGGAILSLQTTQNLELNSITFSDTFGKSIIGLPGSHHANSVGSFYALNSVYDPTKASYNSMFQNSYGDSLQINNSTLFDRAAANDAGARDFNAFLTFDYSAQTGDFATNNTDVSSIALKGTTPDANAGFDYYHEVTIIGNGTANAMIQSTALNGSGVKDDDMSKIATYDPDDNENIALFYGNDIYEDQTNGTVLAIGAADKINLYNTDLFIRGAQRWQFDYGFTIVGSSTNEVSQTNFFSGSFRNQVYRLSAIDGMYSAGKYSAPNTKPDSDFVKGDKFSVEGFGSYQIQMNRAGGTFNADLHLYVDGMFTFNTEVDYETRWGSTSNTDTSSRVYFVDSGSSVNAVPANISIEYSALGAKGTGYAPAKLVDNRTGNYVDGVSAIEELTAFSDYVDITGFVKAYDANTFGLTTNAVVTDKGLKIQDAYQFNSSTGNYIDSDTLAVTGGVFDLRVSGQAHYYKEGYANDGTGLVQAYNFENFQFEGYDETLSVGYGGAWIYNPANTDTGSGNVNWFLVDTSSFSSISSLSGSNDERALDAMEIYLDNSAPTYFNYIGNSSFNIVNGSSSFNISSIEVIQFRKTGSSADLTAGNMQFNFNTKIVEQSYKSIANGGSGIQGTDDYAVMLDGYDFDIDSSTGGKIVDVYVNETLYNNVYNQTFNYSSIGSGTGYDLIFTDTDSGERFKYRLWQTSGLTLHKQVVGTSPDGSDSLSRSYSYIDNEGAMDITVSGDDYRELSSVTDTIYELTAQYAHMNGDYDYFRIYVTHYEVQHGNQDILEYIGIQDNEMYDFFTFTVQQYEAGVDFYKVDIVEAFYQQQEGGSSSYGYDVSYDSYFTAYQSSRAEQLEEQALKEQEAKELAKQQAEEEMQKQEQAEFEKQQDLAKQLEEQAKQEQEEKEQAKEEAEEEMQAKQDEEEANDNDDDKEEGSFTLEEDSDFDFAGEDFTGNQEDNLLDNNDLISFDNAVNDANSDKNMKDLFAQAKDVVVEQIKDSIIQDISIVDDNAHVDEMVINEDNTMSYANESLVDSSAEVDKTFDSNINGNSNQ